MYKSIVLNDTLDGDATFYNIGKKVFFDGKEFEVKSISTRFIFLDSVIGFMVFIESKDGEQQILEVPGSSILLARR